MPKQQFQSQIPPPEVGAGLPPDRQASEPNGGRGSQSDIMRGPVALSALSRESSPSDLRTGSTSGQDRIRPRKRHGVPMRTPALRTCAPARRRKLLSAKALRLAVPGGRGRREREGGAGSDPAVRGTAAGSGPCAFAHLGPTPSGRSRLSTMALTRCRYWRRHRCMPKDAPRVAPNVQPPPKRPSAGPRCPLGIVNTGGQSRPPGPATTDRVPRPHRSTRTNNRMIPRSTSEGRRTER